MRQPCEYCARKHLAQATILLHESRLGYPNHVWLAMGHMAEAEAEILGLYPDVALAIREHRKMVERGEDPDLTEIIDVITQRKRCRTGREERHPSLLNECEEVTECKCMENGGAKTGNGRQASGAKRNPGRSGR